ncbi:hypothetical protein PSHT_15636, partial [Puccinia striiformis]
MESHGAYGRIQLFLEDLNLVLVIYRRPFLGRILTSILTRLGFSKILGGAQHIVRGLGSRIAEEMVKNGLGTLATLHRTPLQLSDPRSTAIPMLACQMRSDTQQLEDYQFHSKRDVDQHRQLEGDCLGFDGDPPVEFAIKTEDVDRMFIHAPYDGQHDEFLEDHHVVAALLPVNFGSAEPPTDDSQDPSELGELHLETASNRDARSDLGIDVDPAQYDQSCSHSSSASVRSLVPSTDNCHESTNFSDPLQTNDNPDHSDCSDQHDQYADGGHYDAGDVYDDHGADLDPGDDYHDNYHDDYYDDGGDFDYYDDDY